MKLDKLYQNIATVFNVGHLPYAPGTWGSLVATFFVFFLYKNPVVYIVVTLLLLWLGIISSTRTEKAIGEKDPGCIVIDEFVGILITFMFIPLSLKVAVIGFILFRLFDIFKIPPMRRAETLPQGIGIMCDDVIAAIYTNFCLRILILLIPNII